MKRHTSTLPRSKAAGGQVQHALELSGKGKRPPYTAAYTIERRPANQLTDAGRTAADREKQAKLRQAGEAKRAAELARAASAEIRQEVRETMGQLRGGQLRPVAERPKYHAF